MINQINKVCFNQWRASFEAMEAEPFYQYDFFQSLIAVSVILAITAFLFFILSGEVAYTKILAYVFLALSIILLKYSCVRVYL